MLRLRQRNQVKKLKMQSSQIVMGTKTISIEPINKSKNSILNFETIFFIFSVLKIEVIKIFINFILILGLMYE